MKKWILLFCCLLLTGCARPTFETLGDIPHQQVDAPVSRKILLELPEEAVQAVWESDGEAMYLCEDYTVHLQTLSGGDLNATIRSLSGFDRKNLTVLESRCGDHDRYEWVWTAVGEGGDELCRCVVLSDGDFHYALTVSAAADTVGMLTEQWNSLLSSFCLESAS